jgi:hypothetical protein
MLYLHGRLLIQIGLETRTVGEIILEVVSMTVNTPSRSGWRKELSDR